MLNAVNYGSRNGTFGSAAFGTITTAFDPREFFAMGAVVPDAQEAARPTAHP